MESVDSEKAGDLAHCAFNSFCNPNPQEFLSRDQTTDDSRQLAGNKSLAFGVIGHRA